MSGKIQKFLIYTSIIICVILFFLLMRETFDKYTKKMTNVGVNIQESSETDKLLPCVTVCPWMAFRSFGFHYSNENFSRNTFEKDEVFLNSSMGNAFNGSMYRLEETRSIFLGRCFTIHHLHASRKMDTTYWALKRDMDYKVFIHKCDAPRLFTLGSSPVETASFQLGIDNQSQIACIKMSITERKQISMNKNGSCRDNYTSENSFAKCTRNFFLTTLKRDNIKCSLPGFETITNDTSLTKCIDKDTSIGSLRAIQNMFGKDKLIWLQQCPLPCELTVFDAKLIKYHLNNLAGSDENSISSIYRSGLLLAITYETFAVHEHIETFIVDESTLLSQIGGNLGLFLGVSCLSVMTTMIQFSNYALKFLRSK